MSIRQTAKAFHKSMRSQWTNHGTQYLSMNAVWVSTGVKYSRTPFKKDVIFVRNASNFSPGHHDVIIHVALLANTVQAKIYWMNWWYNLVDVVPVKQIFWCWIVICSTGHISAAAPHRTGEHHASKIQQTSALHDRDHLMADLDGHEAYRLTVYVMYVGMIWCFRRTNLANSHDHDHKHILDYSADAAQADQLASSVLLF